MLPWEHMEILGVEKINIEPQSTHNGKKIFTSFFMIGIALYVFLDKYISLRVAITQEFNAQVTSELRYWRYKFSEEYNQVWKGKLRARSSEFENIV
jgi:hypothetical protein